MAGRRRVCGSAMLEFALCGIPMLFAWISVVQMGIGMWHYATLQYAVKACGAYITTHGQSYISAGNAAKQIQDAAAVLANQAIGIPTNSVQVTFTALNSAGNSITHTCYLNSCLTDTTTWPPSGYNLDGDDIEVKANYVWSSALAMVAPGPGSGPVNFGAFNLPGYTHQFIVF